MAKEKKEKAAVGSAEIEETIRAIKTKFGDEAIMKLGDKPRVDVKAIPGTGAATPAAGDFG